jgi:exosortase A
MNTRSEALAKPKLSDALVVHRPAIAGLLLGLAAFGTLFNQEVAAAVRTWIDSTAYNHCFLVIPITVYLIWDRRFELAGMVAQPFPRAALAGIPVMIVWLATERLGIMEGRQLMVVTLLQLLFISVLGWRLWFAVSGPLLYLFFLVPFGEFLVPKLQDVTTVFIRHGLDLLQIPAYIDGYTIEIREGNFYVAEACAGLRFLIASIAFGVLYALMMYRSPGRRVLFIAISIIVPVIANGFRALGIVVLGHVLGSAEAAAADHVLYGWIFFSLVILVLIGLGLPFREDEVRPVGQTTVRPPFPSRPQPVRPTLVAAMAMVLVASVSPGIAGAIDLAGRGGIGKLAGLDALQGCTALPMAPPASPNAVRPLITRRFACGSVTFDVRAETFSSRTTAGPVLAERRRLNRVSNAEEVVEDWLVNDLSSPARAWRVVRARDPAFETASGVWIDGQPSRLGLPMRRHLAFTSLFGGASPPVVVTVTPVADWGKLNLEQQRRIDEALIEFLAAHPDLGARVQVSAR